MSNHSPASRWPEPSAAEVPVLVGRSAAEFLAHRGGWSLSSRLSGLPRRILGRGRCAGTGLVLPVGVREALLLDFAQLRIAMGHTSQGLRGGLVDQGHRVGTVPDDEWLFQGGPTNTAMYECHGYLPISGMGGPPGPISAQPRLTFRDGAAKLDYASAPTGGSVLGRATQASFQDARMKSLSPNLETPQLETGFRTASPSWPAAKQSWTSAQTNVTPAGTPSRTTTQPAS